MSLPLSEEGLTTGPRNNGGRRVEIWSRVAIFGAHTEDTDRSEL